jgi:hypothetical protein
MDSRKVLNSDPELRTWAATYEYSYFKDVRFKLKELQERYFKHQELFEGKWVPVYDELCMPSLVSKYLFHYKEGRKEMQEIYGSCDNERREIWINKSRVVGDKERKEVLLHEMIHGYESLLSPRFQQILVLFLHEKLEKKIGKKQVDKMIRWDQNSVIMVHTPLFCLKSLTIDLARHLPLGTINFYGRQEIFSRIVKG